MGGAWQGGSRGAATLIAVAMLCAAAPARATPEVPLDTWVTNGVVNTIAKSGNTIYIGGGFNYVGPNTGNAAVLDATSAALSGPALRISGTVAAAVRDAEG